jgi:membrane-associated phospholipid phosphatase
MWRPSFLQISSVFNSSGAQIGGVFSPSNLEIFWRFLLQVRGIVRHVCRMKSARSGWRYIPLSAITLIFSGSSHMRAEPIDSAPADRQTVDGIRPSNAFSFDTVRLFGDDILYVFTAPSRWDGDDWLTAAGEAGFAFGTTAFDRSIRNSVQAHRSVALDKFSTNFEQLGSGLSFVILAGFEGYHFMANDRRSQEVFLDGLSASLIASGIIVPVLKYSVGRERPSDSGNPYRFRPFTNHNSFPSGHTAQAFAVATVIVAHYPAWWVQVLAYGSAGVVGYCRIEQNAHFTSDVLVGGLIGYSVARSVVDHNSKSRAPRFTIVPYSDGRSSGFLFAKVF